MMPWVRDAAVLAAACSSLRLSRDAHGAWRPLASPEDVERAYALMAETLKSREYDACAEAKRVEETERMRLAVHALVLLALSRGASEADISSVLRLCLVDMNLCDDPAESQDTDSSSASNYALIPPWARRRAYKRLRKCRQQAFPGSVVMPPISSPIQEDRHDIEMPRQGGP